MIDWPKDLVDDLARRRCVMFLGAGVSMNSRSQDGTRSPPSWVEFLRAAYERIPGPKKHIGRMINSGDLLTACELIKERIGDDWGGLLDEFFVAPQYGAAHIHELIFRLDCKIILTQNFDKIFDTYAQATSQNTVRVKSYTDGDVAEFLRGAHNLILKAHGTIDVPAEMIFTRKEYGAARYRYQSFYFLLEALAITHSFLFVGCSISDPDVRMLLEKIAHFFRVSRGHYICFPRSRGAPHPDELRSIKENLSLRALTYDARQNHSNLTESIAALLPLVEERRREFGERLSW